MLSLDQGQTWGLIFDQNSLRHLVVEQGKEILSPQFYLFINLDCARAVGVPTVVYKENHTRNGKGLK